MKFHRSGREMGSAFYTLLIISEPFGVPFFTILRLMVGPYIGFGSPFLQIPTQFADKFGIGLVLIFRGMGSDRTVYF